MNANEVLPCMYVKCKTMHFGLPYNNRFFFFSPLTIFCSFLFDAESDLYQRYRRKVETFRKGVIAESSSRKEEQKKKKKSRWGDESDKVVLAQPGSVLPQMMMAAGSNAPPGTHPQLIQYAIKVFGTTDLDASQWKQCEDQLKVSVLLTLLKASVFIELGFFNCR